MAIKVGIPRSLFYYRYFPLWKTFFEELGAEVIVSDRTSKKILDDGVKSCVDEACLPIKLFHGHVLNLKDKVDYVFIPRYTSVSRHEYICPKFGGLPDMVRNTLSDLPKIIDTEINLWKSKRNSKKAAIEIGEILGASKKESSAAYNSAVTAYRKFREQVQQGILPIDILEKKLTVLKKNDENTLNIAIIGHVYNLYDSYINMNMLNKLKNNKINIITIEMMDNRIIDENVKGLKKRLFWNFGRKAVGTALHILNRKDIDGIIYLMSFGCGIDSFICDMIERRVKNGSNIPFMVLTLDEHSGEAGMDTRLEAFTDMIRWRLKNGNNVSALG